MSSSEDDAYPAAAGADASDEGSGSEDYASLMPQAPVKKSKSGGFESMNLFPPVFRAVRGKGYRVRQSLATILFCNILRRVQRPFSAKRFPLPSRAETSWRWLALAAAKLQPFSCLPCIT